MLSTEAVMRAGYMEVIASHLASVRMSGNKEAERALQRALDALVTKAAVHGDPK